MKNIIKNRYISFILALLMTFHIVPVLEKMKMLSVSK